MRYPFGSKRPAAERHFSPECSNRTWTLTECSPQTMVEDGGGGKPRITRMAAENTPEHPHYPRFFGSTPAARA